MPAQFEAGFGRHFEYYTGLVFQIEIEGGGLAGQIAGGGRYDGLIRALSKIAATFPPLARPFIPNAFSLQYGDDNDGQAHNRGAVEGAADGGHARSFEPGGFPSRKSATSAATAVLSQRMPMPPVEFLSAGEIARHLQSGRIHLGVTGEDLIREHIPQAEEKAELLLKLGFGHADVAVAVPDCWLDVETMADLEEAAALFAVEHGRRLRVATKYPMLTRRFFSQKGVVSYRTVESLGATEGAPAAGSAEAIVDITTTGSTLRANGLRILSDGLILKSEANLVASKAALATWETGEVVDEIVQRVEGAVLSLREREQRP